MPPVLLTVGAVHREFIACGCHTGIVASGIPRPVMGE